MTRNVDDKVVEDFGKEWSKFDQSAAPHDELAQIFARYFAIFPWGALPEKPRGFDLGCGSGRWARFVAPRVAELHCIDPSPQALEVARRTLERYSNCRFHEASVDDLPLPDASADFGYALGVLHHIPDTAQGIRTCVSKLKPGAPLLLYLYYAFDQRPFWFRAVWRASDCVRLILSRAPHVLKYAASQLLALLVYLPLARAARLLEHTGRDIEHLPLAAYRNQSFYTMRTDALDRFGTRLERRFSRAEIEHMMRAAGLVDIRFSDDPPYWCAVGFKTRPAGP